MTSEEKLQEDNIVLREENRDLRTLLAYNESRLTETLEKQGATKYLEHLKNQD
ncbi:hypothetical protein IA935_12820 [Listeria marthii]|uniref:hypothetical protein n=1 Tax=Listeria marthii TaxID=529731 RepID=UPI001889BACE|nr:hypothetical protein [Listeria marthii]MBF2350146.1 hypothetical protein [Listeria marthii]